MKKIIKFIKNNYKYLIFIFFLIGLNLLFIHFLHVTKFFRSNGVYLIVITIINIVLLLFYSTLFSKIKKMKIEKLYLIMIIPIGLLYLCLFPLNTIPDENTHFARIYEISSGHLISKIDKKLKLQGRYFDSSIYKSVVSANTYKKTIDRLDDKATGKDNFYTFSNTSLYSFVCYIPQTVGVLVAKILHLPILLQAYMARLFNFLVFVLLTYFAVKLMPVKKSVLFMVLFFPIVIQEAVSLAPDALTIATTAFLISFVFHLKKSESKITKKEIGILSISSIVLSLCKIVYLPICLIIFLIPKEKFSSLKKKNIIIISIAILAVIINLIWLSISSEFLPDMVGIDSGRQLKNILSNIFNYLLVIGRTYSKISVELLLNSVGSCLGCFSVPLQGIYIVTLIILVIGAILLDNNENRTKKPGLKKYEKLYMFMIIFGTVMLISTSLYLQWTPVGQETIKGIQGRYFIPLYFLLPFLFTKYKLAPKVNFLNKYVYLFLVSINVYALSAIFYNFI